MSFETYVSIASAVASLLAALYASKQARHAAKATNLAVLDHRERHESMQVKLIDGISFTDANDRHIVAMACSIINRAAAPHTIASIELHVHQFNEKGSVSKLILSPIKSGMPSPTDLQPFPSPLNISERSTISGWAIFHIPTHISKKRSIDKFELIFKNTLGQRAVAEQYLLRRIEKNENIS